MMATQELVVPRSIPMTSPASVDDDIHRRGKLLEVRNAAGTTDGWWCTCCCRKLREEARNKDALVEEEDDDAAAVKPLRRLNCRAMVVGWTGVCGFQGMGSRE